MEKTEIIETKPGKIQGYIDNGIKIFKGIPYAEPPIGKLRFLPSEPKIPWNNVLNAVEFGPHAPQPPPLFKTLLKPIIFPQSEKECLTLNIWSPNIDDEKRPVMVWIHGGDFVWGGTATPTHDGSNLAVRGNVVIVTINYRLGVLGFLNIPDVTVNAGSLDQITALKWINENIQFFGGDPDNITIFGVSAGSKSVITLCAMPDAKGLFKRVIAQSTPSYYASNGEKATEEFMEDLGIKPGDIDSLCKLPLDKLLEAQVKIHKKSSHVTVTNPWIPQVDGKTLPQDFLTFFQEGKAEVELIIGSTLDENKLYSILDPKSTNVDMERVKKRVNRLMNFFSQEESKKQEFIEIYIKERQENNYSTDPRDLYDNIASDLWFRILSIRLAEAQSKKKSTYMYLFTWESPFKHPKLGNLGAAHSLDVPFVFGSLNVPGMNLFAGSGDDAEKFSENIMKTWLAFAKTGNPNHAGISKWNTYDSENRTTLFLGKEIKAIDDPFKKTRLIWDGII